jgi:hypothetical protein
MNPIIKNIIAVIAGFILGSIINMSLITVSGSIIPAPNGTDVTTLEGLKATIHLFEPKHFLFPFLAHALGTLGGAFVAAKIAATHKLKFAFSIGFLFLAGGIANILLLPSPLWFTLVDLIGAYLPMAYAGYLLASKKFKK